MTVSISTRRRWLECPRAGWFADIAKAEPSNPPARVRLLGSVKHAGLERAFRAAQAGGNRSGTMLEFAVYAETGIRDAIDRTGGRLTEDDFEACCEEVLAVLASIPAPRPSAILGVEQRFRVGSITGVVDLILKIGMHQVHLRDWKSGGLTGVVVEEDEQLALYSWWARRFFPWAEKVTVGLYSISRNRELVTEISSERGEVVAGRLLETKMEMADAIASAMQPGANPEQIFLPQPGEHCNACPFRSYCPKWTGPAPLAYPAEDVESTKRYLASRLLPIP